MRFKLARLFRWRLTQIFQNNHIDIVQSTKLESSFLLEKSRNVRVFVYVRAYAKITAIAINDNRVIPIFYPMIVILASIERLVEFCEAEHFYVSTKSSRRNNNFSSIFNLATLQLCVQSFHFARADCWNNTRHRRSLIVFSCVFPCKPFAGWNNL